MVGAKHPNMKNFTSYNHSVKMLRPCGWISDNKTILFFLSPILGRGLRGGSLSS